MIEIPPQKPIQAQKVLIIDAQTLVHEVIKSALLELGIKHIQSAENAYYALRLCETTQFDVVMISFDVKSDKDGFNILEEMKFKGLITKSTTVVFLSADTSSALVNCVVELQPNDFWVKPLDRHKIEKRFSYLFDIKKKLYRLNYCVDKQEYATAIYYAERQLADPLLAQFDPQINRVIGDCLLLLLQFEQAETFFKKLLDQCNYGWVSVNLARSLLKQDKVEEAQILIEQLLVRDDTRFATYDVLAEYYIEKENYEKGYEIIKEATKLAPRNIARNKKSWNLARLNHDRLGQYIATQNMAKYAKNSIHDSPHLTLNVIRAAIDLAATLPGPEGIKLLTKTERDFGALQSNYGAQSQLGEQLSIISARMLNLRSEKNAAETIVRDHMNVRQNDSIEDNLDKVKAFHELGHWEHSLALLDKIKTQIEGDSFTAKVINEYIEQESKERLVIHYSPKELVDMASTHYRNKRYKPSYELLKQAMVLTPKNASIALSLIKVIAKIAIDLRLESEHLETFEKCKILVNTSPLTSAQREKMDEYSQIIHPAIIK